MILYSRIQIFTDPLRQDLRNIDGNGNGRNVEEILLAGRVVTTSRKERERSSQKGKDERRKGV